MALRRSPKPGALTAAACEGAAHLVDDQGRERLAVDVLGDDERAGGASCGDLLEQRDQVGDGADLLLVDEDERVLEDGFHALAVGDEVRGDVALVELHALDDLDGGLGALGLLDGDDAVLADLVHGVGDVAADLGVVAGDGGDVLDVVLAVDGLGDAS